MSSVWSTIQYQEDEAPSQGMQKEIMISTLSYDGVLCPKCETPMDGWTKPMSPPIHHGMCPKCGWDTYRKKHDKNYPEEVKRIKLLLKGKLK